MWASVRVELMKVILELCECCGVGILTGLCYMWVGEGGLSILTWRRRYPDPQGGSPMARPVHCTSGGLTYAIFPNVKDSGA